MNFGMSLIPSRQFYPPGFLDSVQSSLCRFHGKPHQFFRYNSSIPRNKNFSYSTKHAFCSDPVSGMSNLSILRCKTRVNLGNNWIDKWNERSKENRLKPPRAVLDYRNREDESVSGSGYEESGSTMDKIVKKLKNFGYIDDGVERKGELESVIEKGSVEDIFYVEEGMLPNTRGGFSGNGVGSDEEVRFPWEKPKKNEEEGRWSVRIKSRTSLAELTLPESELTRLKNLTFRSKHKTKIGGAGVTQEIVDKIHERWKMSEIVRLKIEGAPALNMKRMHEILERKTGGLVIWRSGTTVSLYRGVSYEVPSVQLNTQIYRRTEFSRNSLSVAVDKEKKDTELVPEVKYEDEVDKLLDGLGPRYEDWPGCDPLPIDADMLPGVVPGYQPPFRLLPYGVRSNLGVKEATSLRRLARTLPPHFALGRSRQLQGLAVAMIKLWEKSSIAKIALKRGVQLTTSERMAEDIKKLTGGMLLSRNKDFLVFYRGKNFLSPDVTEALLERERLAKTLQDEEEQARLRASALVSPNVDITEQYGTAGTLGETLDADARWGKRLDNRHKEKMTREAEIVRHASLARKLEQKLAYAERRVMKAEKALSKVELFLKPVEQQADPDSITDEERFMFRKLGLRMKAFLLLGRRGVFDGTVENMHLHWKYRELVKIIVKAKTFDQVRKVALALEAESGGVLVSVDKVSKGYAIIVFRGKDYQRPSILRPKNLLTKRKALARSIELQRREALLNHITALQSKVDKIRSEIDQMEVVKDKGDEELYNKFDEAYPTDDEDTEEEGDEAYLETYDSESDGEDESIKNLNSGTSFLYDLQDQESDTEIEVVPKLNEYATSNLSISIRADEVEREDTGLY